MWMIILFLAGATLMLAWLLFGRAVWLRFVGDGRTRPEVSVPKSFPMLSENVPCLNEAGQIAEPFGQVERARSQCVAAPRPVSSWVMFWFAALMILTVVVRVADPTGWLGSDDASYYCAAEHLRTGETIQRVHHHYARMAVIVPVAISTWLVGDHPVAVALPSFVASVCCVVLIVILGRLVWGWWEGLCAGTIVCVLPYFRVLSTTGFPDIHACMWITAAVILSVLASRQRRLSIALWCGVACGVAAALAGSAKILAAAGIVAPLYIIWSRAQNTRARRALMLASIVGGVLLFCLVEGLFYLWAAGDFWFRVHALQNTHFLPNAFPAGGYYEAESFAELAWDRLVMLARPAQSGWGTMAVAFWPAALIVFLLSPKGRGIAIWAVGTYLIVAFMPISFRNGPQPFPKFDGRNVLFACLPFALCLAWTIRWVAERVSSGSWTPRKWGAALMAIVAIAYLNPHELNGFRNGHTARVGQAIKQAIARLDLSTTNNIFMPASLYIRYRILFPPELRSHLRVAVDDDSPPWWRDASVDILSRAAPLPGPDDAYLLATPRQLMGECEYWDYGVSLPGDRSKEWPRVSPIVAINRFKDKTIGPARSPSDEGEPILLLLGPKPTRASTIGNRAMARR